MSVSTYQPDPTAGMDTYINSGFPDINADPDPNFFVNQNLKGLIKFDVSDIPSDHVCNSATLYLRNGASGFLETVNIYAIKSGNSSWTESGATWNKRDGTNNWAGSAGCSTAGTDYDSSAIATYTNDKNVGDEKAISLNTSTVRTWFGASNSNYGMLFVQGTLNSTHYYSSDYTTVPSHRPKLVIDHSAPTLRRRTSDLGTRVGTRGAM